MTTTPAIDDRERQILHRISRGMRSSESELRYQLERKDEHPLAQSPQLLDVLADLEERGLISSELYFRLTPAGRALLGENENR